jgi:hypothetical protein
MPQPSGALRESFWSGDLWRRRIAGGGVPPDRSRDSGGMERGEKE